ncbi:alpha actinin [Tieghemostelium lacteum]|uniref:Alpha actinin n=1 Tax=Tieghemostelium lacteum TaxID=361077 RepID=A0A152A3U3_TIELA|nr:alpha actinin [Tieghemostelium lacteum]|eukprot:KYR00721.1 alpha actinin [Tieghemostelium lacteum]
MEPIDFFEESEIDLSIQHKKNDEIQIEVNETPNLILNSKDEMKQYTTLLLSSSGTININDYGMEDKFEISTTNSYLPITASSKPIVNRLVNFKKYSLILKWIVLNIVIVIVNLYMEIYYKFKFSITNTIVQLFVSFALSVIMKINRRNNLIYEESIHLIKIIKIIFPFSILYTINVVLNSIASFRINEISKSVVPISCLYLYSLVNKKKFDYKIYGASFLLVLGSVMFIVDRFPYNGFNDLVLSIGIVAIISISSIYTHKIFSNDSYFNNLDPNHLIYYFAPCSIMLLLPVFLLFEYTELMLFIQNHYINSLNLATTVTTYTNYNSLLNLFSILILNSFISFFAYYYNFKANQQYNLLVMNVGRNSKSILIRIFGKTFFDQHGITGTVGGGDVYASSSFTITNLLYILITIFISKMSETPSGSENKLVLDKKWELTQRKTFTAWCNSHLRKVGTSIESIESDFADGIKLSQLLEIISNDPVFKINKTPKLRIHNIQNIGLCLKHIESHNVKLIGIGAEELVDKNVKMTLGMIWTIILRFAIQDISIEELSAKEALLLWCQRKTEGFERVKVQNFHTSFQDGLAFCALIAKHRPDLINYDSLNKDDKAGNLQLAFDIAEKELDIPKMLDVSDMLDVPKPDERSVMTYVAQYYHHFSASRKAENAGKQISKILDTYMSIEQMKSDYIKRATELLQWINSNIQSLDSRDFGESIDSVQSQINSLRDFKSVEKPPRGQEVLELEAIYNSLQTKLRLNKREPFVAPEGLSPVDIDARWSVLEKSEQERSEALRKELKRQKAIAYLLQRFNRILKKLENWVASKNSYLSSTDFGDSITAVQAKLNNLEAFEGEYESLGGQSNNDLTSIVNQLVELQYNGVDTLNQRKDSFFAGQWQDVKGSSDNLKNALKQELAKLQKIEDMLINFAKRAAQLNIWIEAADDNVSDPINADSVEVVNEIQAKFDKFLEEQAQQFQELETLSQLTVELRELGRSENSYSVISYDDLSARWNTLLSAIEERKAAIANELSVQTANDSLCVEFAEKANKINEYTKEQSNTVSNQNSSDPEEQLKSIRTVLTSVTENKALLDDLVVVNGKLEDAQVTENRHTQLTLDSIKLKWEKLSTLAKKSEQVIQGEILAKQHTGVTAEELAEFKACYQHFDKDNDNTLNRLELSSCLKSLGEDLTDDQFNKVLAQIDHDGNGLISFEEFVEYMVSSRKNSDSAAATLQNFKVMADDKDTITEAQIRQSISDSKQVEYLLANMPKVGDAYDYATFVNTLYQ